ncbi:hypothetical protein C7534_10962 [Pseudomonas sp. OV226]|jgi:hypothetical protein|nr:hypothetical protein C7534_10962 [Pseudomonas sp. OV226]
MEGQKPLVTLGFSKVTRCKSETASSRNQNNGYVPNPKFTSNYKPSPPPSVAHPKQLAHFLQVPRISP